MFTHSSCKSKMQEAAVVEKGGGNSTKSSSSIRWTPKLGRELKIILVLYSVCHWRGSKELKRNVGKQKRFKCQINAIAVF